MRICLDARLSRGASGGVEGAVVGLAHGLGQLSDGDEEYLFLTHEDESDWLLPYLRGPSRPLFLPRHGALKRRWALLRRGSRQLFPWASVLWARYRQGPGMATGGPPWSDGTIERAGVDLMHFTFQRGFLTDVPSIYHPHDLQHLHVPQYFSGQQRRWRELWYRTLCQQATMVAVASSWTKQDVVHNYGLPESKVQVVPLAPPTAAYPEPNAETIAATHERYSLPDAYVLYPAQTWPHKNHLALLQALALLRDRYRLRVPLVAAGAQNAFFPKLRARSHELRIDKQISWTGFVSPIELRCLYLDARAVVIPSRFEAASAPLWEAFLAGVPAACSNVTSLPEQAGDAAIVFDPDQPEEIAEATRRLWVDESLRRELIARGRQRVNQFTWERTARLFRAYYRRILGRGLTGEDVELINRAPIL